MLGKLNIHLREVSEECLKIEGNFKDETATCLKKSNLSILVFDRKTLFGVVVHADKI